jgi:hypothetical protein
MDLGQVLRKQATIPAPAKLALDALRLVGFGEFLLVIVAMRLIVRLNSFWIVSPPLL